MLAGVLPRAELDVMAAVAAVAPVCADVRARGAAAVRDYTARFDGVDLPTTRVPADALPAALATLGPAVRAALEPLDDPAVAIATLAAPIVRAEERDDPNVVKVVGTTVGQDRLRALYFTRATAPWGDGPLLHHIGLYAYRRDALARFVALPPSPLEQRERLEQLRAIEAGLRIDVRLVDAVPFGVDTPHDLARASDLMSPTA